MQEKATIKKYEISRACRADLAAIARIYNASIGERNATATLHPVGIEEREAWFDAHEAANRPIYVLREIYGAKFASENSDRDEDKFDQNAEKIKTEAKNETGWRDFDENGDVNFTQNRPDANEAASQNDENGKILAWGSLSDYNTREAYRITTEISVYVSPEARGKGLGGRLVNFMLEKAPEFGVKNVVALIFSRNAASINLFEKSGFSRWGELPDVCDMGGKLESLTILGKKLG